MMKLFGVPFELAILDVDDVIVENAEIFFENIKASAVAFGLSGEPVVRYVKAIRVGNGEVIGNIRGFIHWAWPHIDPELTEKVIEGYQIRSRATRYKALEGSVEAIYWLRERGVRLAICSNASESGIRHRMKSIGIEYDWFEAAHTYEIGFFKPDPRSIEHIFERVNVPRERAVFLGDLPSDLFAARGASTRFCAVLTGLTPRSRFLSEGVPNDHILNRLSEFIALIEE